MGVVGLQQTTRLDVAEREAPQQAKKTMAAAATGKDTTEAAMSGGELEEGATADDEEPEEGVSSDDEEPD